MINNVENKIEMFWYQNSDVAFIAKQLLGKIICTNISGKFTKSLIVETEAYSGTNDKACHANNQKLTKRNKVMYRPGGIAYIYLCYGIHHLFNIVTNVEGKADAVLIRAVQPLEGIDTMCNRRNFTKNNYRLTAGPGLLTKSLGINLSHYGASLIGNIIWIEKKENIKSDQIISTTRIGVDYAGDDSLKPWRYFIKENKWVSRN